MKIKNNYILAFVIWSILTIIWALACVLNFMYGNFLMGFISLLLSVSFSFVSGILLTKSIAVFIHNKEVEFLEYVHEELRKEYQAKNEPFEDFKDKENF